MPKVKKPIQFDYELKQRAVRDLKIVTLPIGKLTVKGVAYFDSSYSVIDVYNRYTVDIDFIEWNGTDIKPVLETSAEVLLAEIEEAAIRYGAEVFNAKQEEAA